MDNVIKITAYTIRDGMRHKSFFALLLVSVLFVWMIRGCYDARYTVNGQMLDNADVVWQVSKFTFHMIAAGMFLMVSMLSMKIFSRDRDDGSAVLFLSRPILRRQYVLGRIAGTWALCFGFMFILHLTIFLTVWVKTGALVPAYLTASVVCSLNLLFVIGCTCYLTLFLPDVVSALFTLGILFVGFISDGGYQIFQSALVRSAGPVASNGGPALWRVLYPKVFMVQAYADTIISKSELHAMGPLHPVLNLTIYILIVTALMLAAFNRKEI